MFTINCGDGAQKIRWLGDVAVFRYEHFYGNLSGTPKGVRFESGDLLPMDGIISDHLQSDSHVWVILKGNVLQEKTGNFRIRPNTAVTTNKKK
ncbi:hypothetical protein IMG5_178900 [Ichthyophthirius multifiliis]|uniref:Uncharacterized protein n=1 Tax=Ichthyophthirius multifiliis TaxID=5932 RepID=G0R2J8_ICHMU|nr:hypothetical protein IMG5_178900 [Ichthyophthirius multifiliis]EGR28310.1 hypothetical protein IMG5_178900 [Ichthyophthirius multifiliis]|eukprot:XP_004027655.1 hypothetical protein IMG5_178900 [Ichthyophthirius multifiliis]